MSYILMLYACYMCTVSRQLEMHSQGKFIFKFFVSSYCLVLCGLDFHSNNPVNICFSSLYSHSL